MAAVRVLIIDDDPFVLRMMGRMLAGFDCAVTTAQNGAQGIGLFRETPHDLVITDVAIPVPQGLETIRTLRELDRALPILAISGGGWLTNCADVLDMACQAGATDSLAKPFTTEQLLDAVAACLLAPASATTRESQPLLRASSPRIDPQAPMGRF